jgi:predicted nucleotidyltransferase
MNREHAIKVLRSLRAGLNARGIDHAGIFGSVGRDQAGESSDVDVVVTPSKGRRFDLFDLGGVQTVLDEGFGGVAVDVVIEPVGRSDLKEAIRRDRFDAF